MVTTEKDLMRLLPFRPLALPLLWVPLDGSHRARGRLPRLAGGRDWLTRAERPTDGAAAADSAAEPRP